MPVTFSWVIGTPPATSPFSPPPSLPPIVGSAVDCDIEPYTQAELLEIAERSFPADYVASLKARPDGGYELFQAAAKLGERVSIAAARWACCMYVIHAHEGAKSTGTVEFFREDYSAGELTVKVGTVVRTANNKEFLTTEDAAFGATDLGPHSVAIEAVTEGPAYDVPGASVSAGGEAIAGAIVAIKKGRLVDAAGDPIFDLAMQVRNTAATTGGADKCLDALGEDLGLPRNLLEDTEAYRVRILGTPDTVSPGAIRRGVNDLLGPYDSAVCLREVGTPLFPGMFYDAGSSGDSPQEPRNNYAYDLDFAARPEDRFKLMLSVYEMRGFLLIGVPRVWDQEDHGAFYDTTTTDTFKLKNAYDTTAVDAPAAAYDGGSVLATGLYKAISDTVRARLAGGVGFDLYIEEVGCF